MNARLKIVSLTILQLAMCAVGVGIFALIKQAFGWYVVDASVDDILVGRKTFWSTGWGTALQCLALPIVFIIGRNAAAVFYRAGRKIRQIKRDMKAALLLERLLAGHDERFSLYLRSFAQEDELQRRKGFWWYVLTEGGLFSTELESLDLFISFQMRASAPMIAIGPARRLGAGRLPPAMDWQALVVFLMQKATVIFVVPGSSEGLVWEMEQMQDAHHHKTIVIMPPAKYCRGDVSRAAAQWHDAQNAVRHCGVTLPAYDRDGALLMLDREGKVSWRGQFDVEMRAVITRGATAAGEASLRSQ